MVFPVKWLLSQVPYTREISLKARFMGPTLGPSGADRTMNVAFWAIDDMTPCHVKSTNQVVVDFIKKVWTVQAFITGLSIIPLYMHHRSRLTLGGLALTGSNLGLVSGTMDCYIYRSPCHPADFQLVLMNVLQVQTNVGPIEKTLLSGNEFILEQNNE